MTILGLAGGRDGKREPKLNPSKSLHRGGPSFTSGCLHMVGDNCRQLAHPLPALLPFSTQDPRPQRHPFRCPGMRLLRQRCNPPATTAPTPAASAGAAAAVAHGTSHRPARPEAPAGPASITSPPRRPIFKGPVRRGDARVTHVLLVLRASCSTEHLDTAVAQAGSWVQGRRAPVAALTPGCSAALRCRSWHGTAGSGCGWGAGMELALPTRAKPLGCLRACVGLGFKR